MLRIAFDLAGDVQTACISGNRKAAERSYAGLQALHAYVYDNGHGNGTDDLRAVWMALDTADAAIASAQWRNR